jgi:peptide/nickel transport system substrate-binding protein
MGERSVFRDVVFSFLFVVVIVELYFIIRQNEHDVARRMDDISKQQSDQQALLRDMLNELRKPGRAVVVNQTGVSTGAVTSTGTDTGVAVADDKIPSREEIESQYVDPQAEPGGTLYRSFASDPGTLNPLTESDASVSYVHSYISESLATRDLKNMDLWVPELATHWEKAQSSWAIPIHGDAKELAARLSAGLSADAKKWMQVSAEPDGRIKIDIQRLGETYKKEVQKVVPDDEFQPIQWVSTRSMPNAGEKDLPDAAKVMERFNALIAAKPALKLQGEQVWPGDAGFVFRLPGAKADAEALVTQFLKEKEQQGPNGQVWEIEKTDPYVFEDKLYYTFHLRPGVRWHDGAPLTGKDFLFTYKALKDPGVDCQSIRNYFVDCEKFEAPTEDTLKFTWRKLFATAFEVSAGYLPLIPEHIYRYKTANELNTSEHNKEAFGTGPYKFKEWVNGTRIVLERNDDYWGVKANYKQIYIRVVKESAKRLQMLKNKQLDFLVPVTPVQWKEDIPKPPFGEPHGLTAFKQYDLYYNYLGWNLRLDKFKDKRVRQALTMATNRDKILHELLYDLGMDVHGTFYSLGPYADPNLKPWPYDPERAKKQFAEAGWADKGDGFLSKDGARLTVKIMFPAASETAKKILIAIQSDLKKVGVDCSLDPIEWAVFLTRVKKHDFDAIMLGWQLSWDPDPYQLWHSSQAAGEGSNHCSFINAEADKIMEQLRRTFDLDEKKKLCWRFDNILHEEQPYTFMFNSMDLVGHNADLHNVYLPLKPGEKRVQYVPFGSAIHGAARYWWTPKNYQRAGD